MKINDIGWAALGELIDHFIPKRTCCSCFIGVFLFSLFFPSAQANGAVNGNCSNCHTMHNSQNGATVVPSSENHMLTDDCVGCHSHDTDETIVTLGSARIPIVYNTTGYPTNPLAGGNFYNVRSGGGDDSYGHNVRGISDKDLAHDKAPGTITACANSCHISLTYDPALVNQTFYGTNGCTGCHQFYKHHGTNPAAGDPETEASGWYRFLGGHLPTRYVEGIEESDWEQNPAAGHNMYKGYDVFYTYSSGQGLSLTHSITTFCGGCHTDFHQENGGAFNSMQSPWLRHPTDLALPETSEYAAYDPVTAYDPEVPVAWVDPTNPTRATAVVMCLSCHRAHGSEYPDMLRWDYSTMITDTSGPGAGRGCFVCHSTKDGIL